MSVKNLLLRMWGVTGFTKEQGSIYIVPFIALGIGAYLDHQDNLRMTRFRDKTALYGHELKPGEKPSWPRSYWC